MQVFLLGVRKLGLAFIEVCPDGYPPFGRFFLLYFRNSDSSGVNTANTRFGCGFGSGRVSGGSVAGSA